MPFLDWVNKNQAKQVAGEVPYRLLDFQAQYGDAGAGDNLLIQGEPKQNIRLVETDSVPKTFVAGWFLADAKTGEKEPIGQRIIEIPEDLDQFESRDPRARFIAYAPVGSVKRGEALVTTGGGKTLPCAACHGADLKGMGAVPPIAGRSPSYMVRQLYDLQSGARAGAGAAQMKPVVENLTVDEMTSIAAYLTTRLP